MPVNSDLDVVFYIFFEFGHTSMLSREPCTTRKRGRGV